MNPIATATPTFSQPPSPPPGRAAREPLFTARGLTKVYPSGETEIRALDGIDLDLYRGELIVLLGASGRENPRCSTSSAVSTRQPAARSRIAQDARTVRF